VITNATDTTATIKYDDGVVEENVTLKFIQLG
jgi:hypothetical protein